jgi:DNA repair exonuclease SbcCD ATPase subunit
LQDERDALRERLQDADLDALRERRSKYEAKIEKRKKTQKELQDKRQALSEERTRLEQRRNRLHALKDRIRALEANEEAARALHGELDRVLRIYEEAKSTLRKEYLAYINQYTNDVFEDLYLNSSYQRITIEEDYDERGGRYDYAIHLVRDDDTTEDPANASGGERALVNLALRAGIYKLIAELEGGHHGRLPPFILDEPTTYLDAGHVGQLEAMLDRIRGWDVPQVMVVSHDHALIHGADHECRVEIDERTGTSRVTMRAAGTGGARPNSAGQDTTYEDSTHEDRAEAEEGAPA